MIGQFNEEKLDRASTRMDQAFRVVKRNSCGVRNRKCMVDTTLVRNTEGSKTEMCERLDLNNGSGNTFLDTADISMFNTP